MDDGCGLHRESFNYDLTSAIRGENKMQLAASP